MAGFHRLERTVEDLRRRRTQHLAVACFSSVAQEWIPEVVRRARERAPGLTVEISLNEPHGGQGRRPPHLDIRNESLDEAQVHLPGYRRHELCVESFAAALPAGHSLAEEPELSMQQLQSESWVDHDIYESPTGRIIRSACQAAGFAPEFSARLDDHHAALSLVAAGLGVAVLPHLALQEVPAGVVVRPLRKPEVQRRIVAHVRGSESSDPVVATALDCLRSQAADLIAG